MSNCSYPGCPHEGKRRGGRTLLPLCVAHGALAIGKPKDNARQLSAKESWKALRARVAQRQRSSVAMGYVGRFIYKDGLTGEVISVLERKSKTWMTVRLEDGNHVNMELPFASAAAQKYTCLKIAFDQAGFLSAGTVSDITAGKATAKELRAVSASFGRLEVKVVKFRLEPVARLDNLKDVLVFAVGGANPRLFLGLRNVIAAAKEKDAAAVVHKSRQQGRDPAKPVNKKRKQGPGETEGKGTKKGQGQEGRA
eukprot:g7218.t2